MTFSNATALIVIAFAMLSAGCKQDTDLPAEEAAADTAATTATVTESRWPRAVSPVVYGDELERRVDELIAAMTTAEKVGQIIQPDIGSVMPEDLREYRFGSILNGGNSAPDGKQYARAEEWLALADEFYDASMEGAGDRSAIPVVWGSDAVHGHANVVGATVFPHNIGLGAMHNPGLMRDIGRVTATEMRATGIGWTFAPTIAVARDDRWGRTYESYSENPELVSDYARAILTGLQGEASDAGFLRGTNVIATAKHFVADGGTADGKDQGDAQIDEDELVRIHATPYVAAIEAGVQVVMASFSSWQGSKVHGSRELLTVALKERMGFDGFIVGDWNAHGQIPGCSNESCPQAINAGLDMFMAPDSWRQLYENTLRQVETGEIPMTRLNDAVRRILRVKVLAGVFEQGRPSSWPGAGDPGLIGSPGHRAVARQAVRESLVLLKNEGGVLPISPEANVLVAGDGADNLAKQMGGWTLTWQGSDVRPADYVNAVSIYDGIAEQVRSGGGTATLQPDGHFEEPPDVAIVVFGEDPYAEFQGDRPHLRFAGESAPHLAVMQRLRAQSIPVVAVFLSGRPMWVNPEINAADAFVAAWLPGSEGGGVADVLLGGHDFVGKLPFSWPRSAVQTANNVGDAGYDPLFEYGYGLTSAESSALPLLAEDDGLGGAPVDSGGVLFADGTFREPWSLFLGSPASTPADATRRPAEAGGVRADVVDGRAQEDSRRLVWSGAAPASASVSRANAVDWSRESNGALAIEMELRVNAAPSAEVFLAMACGEDCAGSVDVTAPLRSAPVGEFARLAVPLACFATLGVDMGNITTGFALETAGTLDVTVASIALGSSAEGRITCD